MILLLEQIKDMDLKGSGIDIYFTRFDLRLTVHTIDIISINLSLELYCFEIAKLTSYNFRNKIPFILIFLDKTLKNSHFNLSIVSCNSY